MDGSNVLLTDFGTALNWTEDGGSTSVDAPGTLTWQYCSPEQASHGERGRPSDVWSLGCIFLEITTVLMGYHVSDMYTCFRTSGSGQRFVRTNLEALSAWLTRLQVNPRFSCKSSSIVWVQRTLQVDSTERPTAEQLLHKIADCEQPDLFCQDCRSEFASYISSISKSVVSTGSPEISTGHVPTSRYSANSFKPRSSLRALSFY